jgi:hypothetical protein
MATYEVNERPVVIDDLASTAIQVQNTGLAVVTIFPLGRQVAPGATVTVPGWGQVATQLRTQAGQSTTAVVTLTAGTPAARPGPGPVTFDPGPAASMAVTVTGGTWYSNEGLTAPDAWPKTVTTSTAYYPADPGTVTVGATVGAITKTVGMRITDRGEETFTWTPVTEIERAGTAVANESRTYAGLPSTLVSATSAHTAAAGEFVQADATSGALPVALPTLPATGALVAVQKTDATTNQVIATPASGGTIDGDPSAVIVAQWAGGVFEHIGANAWRTMSSMRSAGSSIIDSTGAAITTTAQIAADANLAPSATAPASPAVGQPWRSSSFGDLTISNSPGDRRVIITPSLGFEETAAQEPSVWRAGGRYHLLYTAGWATPVLGYAWCPETADPTIATNWTKASSQVLGGGVGGQAGGLFHGNVLIDGTTIYYFYVPAATGKTIRYATATVGTSAPVFTDQGAALSLGTSITPNDPAMGNSCVLKIGSTYYMIWEAAIDNWQMGMASASAPGGPYTYLRGEIYTVWPQTSVWDLRTASGPWAVVDGSDVVLYYHSGPYVSGSLPTEIYRARTPVASFTAGADAWTIDANKRPIVQRAAFQESDQVADPFAIRGPAGDVYLFWEGFNNNHGTASIFCQRAIPGERRWTGSAWVASQAGSVQDARTTDPQKDAVAVLAADKSLTTGAYGSVLATTFRPSGPNVSVSVNCCSSLPTSSNYVFFQVTVSGNGVTGQSKKIGSFVQVQGGYQVPFSGTALFTGLQPGLVHTFTVEAQPFGGTWSCRAVGFPDNEQCSMRVTDAAFPANESI